MVDGSYRAAEHALQEEIVASLSGSSAPIATGTLHTKTCKELRKLGVVKRCVCPKEGG